MNRQMAEQLHEEINSVMESFAKSHNMTYVAQRGMFGSNDFTVKVKLVDVGDKKELFKQEAEKYSFMGVNPEWIGKQFSFNGQFYTIEGLNMNRRKYPVAVVRSDGKKYGMSIDTVKRLI
jgi:hypothetical protein